MFGVTCTSALGPKSLWQKKAVMIAVRNASGRRCRSKLDEWLAGGAEGSQGGIGAKAESSRGRSLTGAMRNG